MTTFLDRVDAAPVVNNDFTFEFMQWITVLVDQLNETIEDIENVIFLQETVTELAITPLVNATYIIDRDTTSAPIITLPAIVQVGSVIKIRGKGSQGWELHPAVGQTIEVAGTTASTSITSSSRYDSIDIMCITANTTWIVTASSTSGFVIV